MRSAELDVTEAVTELQEVRERAQEWSAGGPALVCPFKGLAPFDVDDAEYFFGRERLVAELVARLVGASLLAIVGPSGSGKSSVLRAGLLPAVAAGVLPGSERWIQALLRPGAHPMAELVRVLSPLSGGADADVVDAALARLAPDRRLVIAVDQAEEVFTACREDAERQAFLDALVAAARDATGRVVVVPAIRADFYGRFAAHPDLARMLGGNHVLVGPMRRDELRRAIERPAERAGLVVEPELAAALVDDVAGEPGGLPLLSTALLELWQRRDGQTLRMAAYQGGGGLRSAVARLAESAYDTLDPEQRRLARGILLRLADGEGRGAVRRRVALAELDADRAGSPTGAVLATLADRRLVTISDGSAEVAHEALLREWPRLRGWLEEDAQGRRLHRHLAAAAQDWEVSGRDPGELYRGARLAAALEWADGRTPELNERERAFLEAARAASEREQARVRRTNRRLRGLLAGVGVLLLVALVAGIVALDQRGTARREATSAEAQRLGAQALTEDRLDRSLLLARQGVAVEDSVASRGNLLAALLRSPAAIAITQGDGDRILAVDVSRDGRTLAIGDNDGTVVFRDTRTRREVGRRYQAEQGSISQIAYAPRAGLIAVSAAGVVDLLDARRHTRVVTFRGPRPDTFAAFMSYARDGALVVEWVHEGPQGPDRIYLARHDGATGRPLGAIVDAGPFRDAGLVAAGDRVVLGSGIDDTRTAVYDARLRRVATVAAQGFQLAASPDGRTVALADAEGAVRFLDVRSGAVRSATGRHAAPVLGAAFTPDGRFLVTGGDDAKVIVWDVRRAAAGETFEGHAGRITSLAVSPDGATAYTGSLDSSVIAWDLRGARRLGRPFRVGPGNGEDRPFFARSADGRTIAIPQADGAVALLDGTTLARRGAVRVTRSGRVFSVALTADGGTLAAGTEDGRLSLFDVAARRALGPPLAAHEGPVGMPSFDRSGRLLLTGGADGRARLWDVRRRAPIGGPLPASGRVDDVTMSPDGRRVALTIVDGPIEILDVRTRKRVARVRPVEGGAFSARFSDDGETLAVGGYEGQARLLGARDLKPIGPPLTGHAGFVLGIAFSPDRRTVATTSTDGLTRLFEARTGKPIGTGLPGVQNRWAAAAFSSDGRTLLVVYSTGRAYAWDIRPSAWERHACQVAGRELTAAEWNRVGARRDYRPVCGESR